MNDEQTIDILVSPEKFFSRDLRFGELRGNENFIDRFIEYLSVLKEAHYWPESKLELMRLAKFKKLSKYIGDNSFFWSQYFMENNFKPETIRSLSEINSLPVLRRERLVELGEKIFIKTPGRENFLLTRSTGGTSGLPMKLLLDDYERIVSTFTSHFQHPIFERISVRDLLHRKFIVMLGTHGARYTFNKDFTSYFFSTLTSFDLEDKIIRQSIYSAIRESAPTFLIGFASLILKFAQMVEEDGVTLPIFGITIGSDNISMEGRAYVEKIFGVPIKNTLSSNGIGAFGYECLENPGKFHLNAEHVLLDFVDDKGNVVTNNEQGEMVLTSLTYTTTPVLRYATGDIGRILKEVCPCGRTLPLFEFSGRRGNEVVLPSGKKIAMVQLHSAAMGCGLAYKCKQVQIIQNEPANLRILIIPKKIFGEEDEMSVRLALTRLFNGEKINIEIDRVVEIKPGAGNKPHFFIPFSDINK